MQRVYEPVGACIFCRNVDESLPPNRFTDEHILAFSLGGTVVLPQATCDAHQEVTKKLDDNMARKWLGTARHVLELPSRTRSDWKTSYRMSLRVVSVQSDISFFVHVPVTELPALYAYESLHPPGLLINAPSHVFRGAPVCFDDSGTALKKLVSRMPPGSTLSYESGGYEIGQMERMLAKVAHTFLTAELGHGNFVPTLLEIIEGDISNARHFVGGFDPVEKQDKAEFTWREELRNEIRYAAVSISINALADLPKFQVLAGVLVDPIPFPERSRERRDAARDHKRQQRRRQAEQQGLFGRHKETKTPRKNND